MNEGITIDLSPVMVSCVKVFLKPYQDFLAQMMKDGRVTEEEMARLLQQVLEQGERLGDFMQEDLASRSSATLPSRPDDA